MKHVLALLALSAALTSVAPAAAARTRAFDPRALARYDISYAKCESLFPAMLGHRDEAYLNLWRISSNDKTAARLAGVRGGAVYRSEKQLVLQGAAKATAPAASGPLEQECQGLWGEYQRVGKDKK